MKWAQKKQRSSCVVFYCLMLTPAAVLASLVICCLVMSSINIVVFVVFAQACIWKRAPFLALGASHRMSGFPSSLVPFRFDCDTYEAPVQVLIESGKTVPTMMQLDVNAQGQHA